MNDELGKSASATQRHRTTFGWAALTLLCAALPVACNKSSSEPTAAANSASVAANLGPVEVPTDGKEFKPPVQASQIPAGAWYCDMGSVHWAQMKEGDHTCPICKMDLKHKQ